MRVQSFHGLPNLFKPCQLRWCVAPLVHLDGALPSGAVYPDGQASLASRLEPPQLEQEARFRPFHSEVGLESPYRGVSTSVVKAPGGEFPVTRIRRPRERRPATEHAAQEVDGWRRKDLCTSDVDAVEGADHVLNVFSLHSEVAVAVDDSCQIRGELSSGPAQGVGAEVGIPLPSRAHKSALVGTLPGPSMEADEPLSYCRRFLVVGVTGAGSPSPMGP